MNSLANVSNRSSDTGQPAGKAIKPRFIGSLLFMIWGWQVGLSWIALPLATILEARYFLNLRWDFQKTDFYRVADFVTLLLAGLVIFLIFDSGRKHFVIELVQWLPLVFYPLVIVYAYSTSEKMSLDVIFYSLRKQREEVKQFWDMDYIYVGICLAAIGTSNSMEYWFFLLAAVSIGASLLPLRSPRYPFYSWILIFVLVLILGIGAQSGLRNGHLWLKEKSTHWINSLIKNRIDPLRTSTSLGYIGQLKLSDSILFRLKIDNSDQASMLLQEAVYDLPSGTNWLTIDANKTTIRPSGGFNWKINESANDDIPHTAIVYLEFDKMRDLVPVPAGVTELREFPADSLSKNSYGALVAEGLFPTNHYFMHFNHGSSINTHVRSSDLYFPEEYEHAFTLNSLTTSLLSDKEKIKFVRDYFSKYTYSLYQPNILAADSSLDKFLNYTKSGHCEFFASATVLMLRYLGVPARYVVGYSMQEFDSDLSMYVVRKRHAHAWAIAWINGQWQTVDTTPSNWASIEEENRSYLDFLGDAISRNYFKFQIWWELQKLEDYEYEMYALIALLMVILIWRLSRSRQVVVDLNGTKREEKVSTNIALPLHQLEDQLSDVGLSRQNGELLFNWFSRVGVPLNTSWINTHYRWRFYPDQLSAKEKETHIREVSKWLTEFSERKIVSSDDDKKE